MGYETKFLLTHDSDEELDLIDSQSYHIEYDEETDGIKWYDFHEEMKAHSAKYPEVTFTLSGDGEDSDDFWLFKYRGGDKISDKRGSNLFAFEQLTRKKMENEFVQQMSGVFPPDDVVFGLNALRRAFDKLGVE